MAEITAVSSGNVNDANNWNPAQVPTSSDTVIIGAFVMSVPSGFLWAPGAVIMTGASAAARTAIIVNSGGILVQAGVFTVNGWNRIRIEGLGIWDMFGHNLTYTINSGSNVNNIFELAGADRFNHARLIDSVGGAHWGAAGNQPVRGKADWQHFTLKNMSFGFGGGWYAGHPVNVRNGVFKDLYEWTLGSGFMNGAEDFIFNHVDVVGTNSASTRLGLIDAQKANGEGGTHQTLGVTIDPRRHGMSIRIEYLDCERVGWITKDALIGSVISSNHYLTDSFYYLGPNATWTAVGGGHYGLKGTLAYIAVNNPHTTENFNSIVGALIDAPYTAPVINDGADHCILPDDEDFELRDTIILDKLGGVALNALGSPHAGNYSANHNTIIVDVPNGTGRVYGTLARTETGGSFTGTLALHNNLCVVRSNPNNYDDIRGINLDTVLDDQITSMGNNAWLGYGSLDSDRLFGVASASKTLGEPGFGGGDLIDVPPNFVDISRDVAAWQNNQNGGGAANDAINSALLVNGYSEENEDQSGAPSGFTAGAVITWINEGLKPTAIEYNGSADDGGTIGAADYLAPVENAPTGGAVIGGESVSLKQKISSGGVSAGGQPDTQKTKTYNASGGVVIAASASGAKLKTFLPIGGVATGDSSGSETRKIKIYVPGNGVLIGGATTGNVKNHYTPGGGFSLGADATKNKNKVTVSFGGVALLGAGASFVSEKSLVNGGTVFGGSAVTMKTKRPLVAGGLSIGGGVRTGAIHSANGGATIGGNTPFYVFPHYAPMGGVVIQGEYQQTRPDDFAFETVTGMLPGVEVIAQMVISGLPEGINTRIKVTGDGSPEWRWSQIPPSFNSWRSTERHDARNGYVIQIRNTSATAPGGVVNTTLTLNGIVTATFSVTTHSNPAVTFDAASLALPTVRGAPWVSDDGETGKSEVATLTSAYPDVSVPIIAWGGNTRLSINGGEFGYSPGIVRVGDSIQISNSVVDGLVRHSYYNAAGVDYALIMLPRSANILYARLYDGNRLLVYGDSPRAVGAGGTSGFLLKSNYGPIELSFDESQSNKSLIALLPNRDIYADEVLTLDYVNPNNTGFGRSVTSNVNGETYLAPLLSFDGYAVDNRSYDVLRSQEGGAVLLGAGNEYKHKHHAPIGGYGLAGEATREKHKHVLSMARLGVGGAAFSRKNKNYTDETLALSFITLPVWLNRGSVRAMARWLNTWWQQVHQWVQSPLNQIDPETCGLAVLGLLAWQRNIDRFDNEPEKLYRARVKFAFVNAIDAGSVAGTKRIFERLGIGQIDIKERVNGKDWDVIVLTMDDSQYSENVTLLQWLVQAYGRTCRRYEFSVNSPTRAGIAVHEFGTEFNYEDAA